MRLTFLTQGTPVRLAREKHDPIIASVTGQNLTRRVGRAWVKNFHLTFRLILGWTKSYLEPPKKKLTWLWDSLHLLLPFLFIFHLHNKLLLHLTNPIHTCTIYSCQPGWTRPSQWEPNQKSVRGRNGIGSADVRLASSWPSTWTDLQKLHLHFGNMVIHPLQIQT